MNIDAPALRRYSRHTSPSGQEVMSVGESILSDDRLSEVRVKEYGLAGPGILTHYDYSLNLGIQNPHNYPQRPDSLPMEGLSGASFPFSIAISPENFEISMPLYDSGHQGDPSIGLPVAYNSSPPSIDVDAEWWMAALKGIPIYNRASNTSTERPILPEAIVNEQSLPPEESFHDLVNTFLTSPYIDDPLFAGRIENLALAPVFTSPLQNDPGPGDFIASMCGSSDKFSMETPSTSQNAFSLLGISPPSTRSAFGSNHLSAGSLSTEAIYTPAGFTQPTTIAAELAFSNTPCSRDPFVTTHEITAIHSYPCPPISNTSTISPLFPPPNPPLPPTDEIPPPLYILPDSVPLPRHRQHPPRPTVCEKHFGPSPEAAPFPALMNRARAHPELREPAMLKRDFCSRNKGACPNQRHPSTCFTILVGPFRNQCRTESVALRDIQKVLGLCWTCNTCGKCFGDNNSLRKHICEPIRQHPFTTNLTQDVIYTMPQSLE